MSKPGQARDVKLISSIFSAQEQLIDAAIARMEDLFGPVDWRSPLLPFDRTRYYEKEMGWPLQRRFLSFRNLVRPDDIVEIKLKTNDLEAEFRVGDRRTVNIDPGYIALERMILATGKNYTHRIYLTRGIYGDLTLVFRRGTFTPLEWTYRDYADSQVIEYFNLVRERYKQELKSAC
ncbi:MAG: DUF4416 family protein [Deltaproteobacteria bacterium]|nr:DUF4416 family protein [Deltaproteobacteria bacterium]